MSWNKILKYFFEEPYQKIITWLYQHDPEGRAQSKQRLSSVLIKAKVDQLTSKAMVNTLRDTQGTVPVDFLEGQRMIT